MKMRERCGQMPRDGSNIACDRWEGHEGDHRGYREQQDAVMFWPQICDAHHVKTGARCEKRPNHDGNHRGAYRHGIAQWP